MARWLVTGGCGFIGSHLVDALTKRGDKVRVLDDLSTGRADRLPSGAELVQGDVSQPSIVREAIEEVDGIFHLAAVASVQRCTEDWWASHRTNVSGTVAVLEAARKRNGQSLPVVYASSAAVYGDNQDMPLTEAHRTTPLSAYGVDKLASEFHARVAWSVYRIPTVGLRFFNVYGPRQDPQSPYSGVIAIFANRIAARGDVRIHGDGQQTRDFIFVGDVVDHLIAAMSTAKSGAQIFNVCTGRATSVLQLAHLIGELAGCQPCVRYEAARIGDIRTSIGNPSVAQRSLGISDTRLLKDGLRWTLESLN